MLLPGGHFDAYVEEFDVASAAACDCFATHLKAATRLSHRDGTPGFLAVPAHEVGDCHAIRLHAPAKLKTLWRDGTMRLVMSPLESIRRLAALVSKLQRPALRPTERHPRERLLRVDESRAVVSLMGREQSYSEFGSGHSSVRRFDKPVNGSTGHRADVRTDDTEGRKLAGTGSPPARDPAFSAR